VAARAAVATSPELPVAEVVMAARGRAGRIAEIAEPSPSTSAPLQTSSLRTGFWGLAVMSSSSRRMIGGGLWRAASGASIAATTMGAKTMARPRAQRAAGVMFFAANDCMKQPSVKFGSIFVAVRCGDLLTRYGEDKAETLRPLVAHIL
jgi:hypothetical protein